MFGLPRVDLLVILLYFAVTIAIGFWAMRRIKNQVDYFLAGRRFGKLIQIFAAFGNGTSADTAVGVTTKTYDNGVAGIWISLTGLFTTPIYWMTTPWYRRLRLITLGDFFEERYQSKTMGGFYAITASIFLMAVLAAGYIAMATTISAITVKEYHELNPTELAEYERGRQLAELESIPLANLTEQQKETLDTLRLERPRRVFPRIQPSILIWVVGAVVLIYAVAGGLEAAFLTDLIQGLFIIVLSILFLPFGLAKINQIHGGGQGVMNAWRTVHTQLPESFFELFGSRSSPDFTWYYIAAVSVLLTLTVAVQPNQMVIAGSAKDELSARIGFTSGNYIKRVCTVLWGVFGLIAVVLYFGKVENSDYVWGLATRDLLGSAGLGLVGLMIACLMAALMSSASAFMITSSSLLTHNVFRPLFPNLTERQYVLVGRLLGACVIVGGALLAVQFDQILQILKFVWEYNLMLAAAFWMGMKWRRANAAAAWASIVGVLLIFLLVPLLPAIIPSLRTNDYLLKTTRPIPMEHIYTARPIDVEQREREIAQWDKLNAAGQADGTRPKPLAMGDKFSKSFTMPPKSIFWTLDIKRDAQGRKYGSGLLNPELVLLDWFGFDLAGNSYALNETIRIVIRTIIPFVIFFLVALLTSPMDQRLLDRFYVRMKTPVLPDHDADAREVACSYANPDRFNHLKLFPRSNWEFDKWDKVDTVGFILAVLCLFGILGMLYLIISIGA